MPCEGQLSLPSNPSWCGQGQFGKDINLTVVTCTCHGVGSQFIIMVMDMVMVTSSQFGLTGWAVTV